MISTQTTKFFALAMIATTAQAGVADSCTAKFNAEIRPVDYPNYAYTELWVAGYYRAGISPVIGAGSEIVYCENDSTLRNMNNQCLTWSASTTDETLGTNSNHGTYQDCVQDDDNQFFTVEVQESCQDGLGNDQVCFAFLNKASQTCLGNQSGHGNNNCSVESMFRDRGAASAKGVMINRGSERCIVPVENSNFAQVSTVVCDNDDLNQHFTIHTNGEIRHDVTGYCLGTEDATTGIFSISSCADNKSQGFVPEAQVDGTYILTSMIDATQCATELDMQDTSVAHRECTSADNQKWDIGSNEWSAPTFTWVEMGCGNGVETSYAYSEAYAYIDANNVRSEAHEDLIDAAKDALYKNLVTIPNGVTVNPNDTEFLSQNYAQMMYHPSDVSIDRSHLFTCGADATCMYRSVMTMHNGDLDADLEWITGYTRCIDSAPVCVPLTEYDNEDQTCNATNHYEYTD